MPTAATAATSRWCGFRVAAYLSPWSDSCVCFVLVIYNNMRTKQHRLLHLSQLRVMQLERDVERDVVVSVFSAVRVRVGVDRRTLRQNARCSFLCSFHLHAAHGPINMMTHLNSAACYRDVVAAADVAVEVGRGFSQ